MKYVRHSLSTFVASIKQTIKVGMFRGITCQEFQIKIISPRNFKRLFPPMKSLGVYFRILRYD